MFFLQSHLQQQSSVSTFGRLDAAMIFAREVSFAALADNRQQIKSTTCFSSHKFRACSSSHISRFDISQNNCASHLLTCACVQRMVGAGPSNSGFVDSFCCGRDWHGYGYVSDCLIMFMRFTLSSAGIFHIWSMACSCPKCSVHFIYSSCCRWNNSFYRQEFYLPERESLPP